MSNGPTWGYKKTPDGYESKLFPDGKLPKGWKDTPAGMTDANSRKDS